MLDLAPLPTPVRPERLLFQDSTLLLEDASALRERAEADGYLFFKQLLPRQALLDLRADMLAVVERHGWREPGQDAFGGRLDLDALNRVPDVEMRTTKLTR